MKSFFSRFRNIAYTLGIIAMLAAVGFGCKGGQKAVEGLPQIQLEYWTVWDEPDAFQGLIAAYREQHPNVRINVRKMSFDDYETRLLQAWARGEGPDLFSIPNASVGKYRDLITPLPAAIKLPALVVSGGCSKNVRVVEKPTDTPRPELLDQTFLPVVADDVIFDNTIHGLPLATDTLGLFFNKDLLTAAKIIAPPQTWQELTDMVDATKSGLTKEEAGKIVQSGIALGTAANVNRSVDILSALMMQSGTQMTDTTGKNITFGQASPTDKTFIPGAAAVDFYTAFANPARVTYSWNAEQPNALEAFAAGKVGFFIGYSYQVAALRRLNPQLNFGVAALPQISQDGPRINYANYWVESVAAQSKHPDEAWDFLLFITSEKQVAGYLEKTKKPTALKSLLAGQSNDLDLHAFVDQLLLAKTWYHGYDDSAMQQYMEEMITAVLDGTKTEEALGLASQKIQQTMKKPK